MTLMLSSSNLSEKLQIATNNYNNIWSLIYWNKGLYTYTNICIVWSIINTISRKLKRINSPPGLTPQIAIPSDICLMSIHKNVIWKRKVYNCTEGQSWSLVTAIGWRGLLVSLRPGCFLFRLVNLKTRISKHFLLRTFSLGANWLSDATTCYFHINFLIR